MSFHVDAETIKNIVAKPAGPPGWNINFDIKQGAEIRADGGVAQTELNEQSLAAARTRAESGPNKEVAASLKPRQPQGSSALGFIESQREKVDARYQSLFTKRKLPTPNYRASLAPNAVAKNPLMRIRQRQLLQLRKTFDEIAAWKNRAVALNPELLPQQIKEKIVQSSLEKGEKNTPFGHIHTPGGVAKTLGKTAINAWKKWDAVGALAAGSFIDLAPRLRKT